MWDSIPVLNSARNAPFHALETVKQKQHTVVQELLKEVKTLRQSVALYTQGISCYEV